MSNPGRTSNTPGHYIFKIWQTMKSAKLALLLILVFAVSVTVFLVRAGGTPVSGIFGSPWLLGLSCVMLLNLAACTVSRLTALVRYCLASKKIPRLGSLGITLFHLGLMFVICGGFSAGFLGMSGYMMVAEGETRLENHNGYESINEGALFKENAHKNFAITLLKQSRLYNKDGTIKKIVSELQISDDVGKTLIKLEGNGTAQYGGIKLYGRKFGFAPKIKIVDETGSTVSQSYVLVDTVGGPEQAVYKTEGLVLPELPYKLDIQYYPENPRDGSDRPSMHFRIRDSKRVLAQRLVDKGQPVIVAGYTISFDDTRFWTGLEVKKDPGKAVIYAGYVLSIAGLLPALSKGASVFVGRRTPV